MFLTNLSIVEMENSICLFKYFDAFLKWILDLRAELHVPHTLKDFGVGKENFALMAKMAPDDPTAGGNPVSLTEKDALNLFEKAYSGAL